MAEREGFEPPEPFGPADFKSAVIGLSTTAPHCSAGETSPPAFFIIHATALEGHHTNEVVSMAFESGEAPSRQPFLSQPLHPNFIFLPFSQPCVIIKQVVL